MVVLGIISYKVFPARLGGQKGVAYFYKYFSKECNLLLAASADNNLSDIPFDKAYNFLFNQWKGFFNIFYVPRLIKIIREQKVDVVILEHSYFGWLGILLKAFSGKPFVIHSHNIESHRFNVAGRKWWRLYVRYEAYVHQKADYTFFICEEDKIWGIEQWKLNPGKCKVITYGTEINQPPSQEEKIICRKTLAEKHSINNEETVFFFNGSLNYEPNIECLRNIIGQLIPILQQTAFKYRIIICGDFLADDIKQTLQQFPQIIYTGYVNDLSLYFKAADAFIIPSIQATGIKTKLIEALANNLAVIATKSGARGIDISCVAEKLTVVENEDWQAFAQEMIQFKQRAFITTPGSFYNEFYWGNIAAEANLSLCKSLL